MTDNTAIEAFEWLFTNFVPKDAPLVAEGYCNIVRAALLANQWQDISTAPRDGSIIRIKIGEMSFLVKWQDGFMDSEENDCGCWVAVEENHHPECWTDGVCWESNADMTTSEQPTHWLPQPPKGDK